MDSPLHGFAASWILRFIFFHGKRQPREMGGAQVEAFLSRLATGERVAASTQNQALSALPFLYREVIEVDLPWMDGVVRAKRPKHVPVVLTENEVCALLAQLEGTRWRVVSLLYGSGIALARKYPRAGRSWIWQYAFSSGSRSVDPADGAIRRQHPDEKIAQRATEYPLSPRDEQRR